MTKSLNKTLKVFKIDHEGSSTPIIVLQNQFLILTSQVSSFLLNCSKQISMFPTDILESFSDCCEHVIVFLVFLIPCFPFLLIPQNWIFMNDFFVSLNLKKLRDFRTFFQLRKLFLKISFLVEKMLENIFIWLKKNARKYFYLKKNIFYFFLNQN